MVAMVAWNIGTAFLFFASAAFTRAPEHQNTYNALIAAWLISAGLCQAGFLFRCAWFFRNFVAAIRKNEEETAAYLGTAVPSRRQPSGPNQAKNTPTKLQQVIERLEGIISLSLTIAVSFGYGLGFRMIC
jgi:hypothetical protein